MLIDSYLSDPRNHNPVIFQTTSLIDSGCIALSFADEESIVKRFNIPVKTLVNPRSVRLPDGSTQTNVNYYFTFRLNFGHHSEIQVFFVTKLGENNPIILGLP